MQKQMITLRLTEDEYDVLVAYAGAYGRTYTDVLREFIRSLEAKMARRQEHGSVIR